MAISLDRVALIGRTYNEYNRMFGISKDFLAGKRVLDAAAGVSNYCAIANVFGLDVTAVDPIYNLSPNEIEMRAEEDLDQLMHQLPFNKTHYNWSFYGDLEGVKVSRVKAYKTFLKDFERNKSRYVTGSITALPFADKSFDVTLVSHLMFLFDHLFNETDQILIFKELVRVTKEEILIFPTKNLAGENSKWVDLIIKNSEFLNINFKIERSEFEFQKGNSLRLRVLV